jgi:prepilin-type N-terminal cleavage/methylation domain-containing protein
MPLRRRERQAGFTIVEVLVALSIFLLVLMGIMQIFEPSNMAYQSSPRKLAVQQNGRVAMDVMVRQIRMAGYFPENIDTKHSNDQSNTVEVATNAAIAVAGDLDGSGVTNTFLFCLDSGGLKRVQGARGAAASYSCRNGAILAEGVTSLGFAYYDANNNPVPDPPSAPYQLDGQSIGAPPSFASTTQRAAVRRIVITLTARENVPGQPSHTYTLTSDVRLRNPS